jgi:GT2 family glycosyltransferase
MTPATVTVVTVAYGNEPWLESSVEACLRSRGVRVDVVLVDNGCTDGAVDRLEHVAGVTVVRPSGNLGFAAGSNIGVASATGTYVALVNPDALVDPDALARLVAAATPDDVAISTASVRLAGREDRLNCAGLALHFLGVSWAGSFEEPAADHTTPRDVPGGSGAAMAARRAVWDELGGFCPELFAYYEDCDLGVRAWQRGLRCVFVPDAKVVHRYEFGRSSLKHFLVERNRGIMVLTLWSTRSLLLLAPAFVVAEVGVLALALRQGWAREKVRSWTWLMKNASWLVARRRAMQTARTRSDRVLVPLFEELLAPANYPLPAAARLQAPLTWWWRLVRRLL